MLDGMAAAVGDVWRWAVAERALTIAAVVALAVALRLQRLGQVKR